MTHGHELSGGRGGIAGVKESTDWAEGGQREKNLDNC